MRAPLSMARMFARYFAQTMLLQFVLLLGFVLLLIVLSANSERERLQKQMDGTVRLIQRELLRQPPARRDASLRELQPLFAYPLALVRLPPASLGEEARARLASGQSWLDSSQQNLYAPLPGTSQLLVIGPLDSQGSGGGWLHSELGLFVLWFAFFGVPLALLIYLNLRPHWHDLAALRDTSLRLAEGDLGARAPAARSPLFSPLQRQLNSMAEKLETQMETRQALAHAIAHELRTPVARLRFGLTMMDEAESDDERRGYRDGMERDMQELDELINVSLSYSKLDRGEVPLEYDTIDLEEWFEDLIELVQPLRPTLLQLTLDCARGEATFDRRLVYVATRNLLLNAFKYARQQVCMTVAVEQGQLIITVDDDGPGIPEKERERIFDPFQRLDRSRDRATGGYGLGLSFVRLIAHHHGGKAWIAQSPQGGARFGLTLPLHPAGGAPSQSVT
ncbi:two-component sensor protein [Vogesella sp. EB]|uniref:ATP-binding protein n=1 Tax=Vogesella sp. EB TaxID=1526735 RepID=UPI00064CDEFF|nr:ATP-binding protein [Vogesella sp. EB]KMJ52427.1 two-component sensor protein [Vogesella sp. EB]